jgi:hypothetical protein
LHCNEIIPFPNNDQDTILSTNSSSNLSFQQRNAQRYASSTRPIVVVLANASESKSASQSKKDRGEEDFSLSRAFFGTLCVFFVVCGELNLLNES